MPPRTSTADTLTPRIAGVALVVIVASGGLYVGLVRPAQQEQSLRQSWQKADAAFRQSLFADAREQYARMARSLTSSDNSAEKSVALAADMQELTGVLAKLHHDLDGEGKDAGPNLDRLDVLRPKFAEAAGDASPEPSGNSTSVSTSKDGEGLPLGLAFSRRERWSNVAAWLEARAQRMGERLQKQPVLDETLAATFDRLAGLVLRDSSNDELTSLRDQFRLKTAYQTAERELVEATRAAEKDLEAGAVARARTLWSQIASDFPKLVRRQVWEGYQSRIQARLLDSARKGVKTGTAVVQPGQLDARGPEVFPLARFAALSSVQVNRPLAETGELVFARHNDCCLGLDAASGRVRWICRVGHDAAWLPVQAGSQVVIPWTGDDGEALTLADATNLTTRWTWRIPDGNGLAGPPVPFDDHVLIWLRSGELWKLGLGDGVALGSIRLPREAGGPLAMHHEGRSAAVIDKSLAVYVLGLAPRLSVESVVLPEAGESTVDAWLCWIDPFLMVCENQLEDRSRVIVLKRSGGTIEEVQRFDVHGRFWQAPVLHGQTLLSVSDLGWEAIQGLQVARTREPVFTLFEQPPETREWPLVPQVLSHPQAPFVAALGNRVVRYRVDRTAVQARRPRELAWTHAFPHPDWVPVQPLQATSHGIVAVARRPSEVAARVDCLDFAGGNLLWSTRVGDAIAEIAITGDDAPILLRSAAGDVFRLTPGEPDRPARLGEPGANATADFCLSKNAIGWVEPSPPELRFRTLAGVGLQSVPLAQPAASPVAILDGPLSLESGPVAGPWAAVLDTERTLQLKTVAGETATQFTQLGGDLPGEGWHRPAWNGGGRLVLCHPRGDLVFLKPQIASDVVYLAETARLQISAGFSAAPVVREGLLWLGCRDSRLRGFDALTAELKKDIPLDARPVTLPSFGEVAAVGLADGRVSVLDLKAGKVLHSPKVSLRDLTHVACPPQGTKIWVFDAWGTALEVDASRKMSRDVDAVVSRRRLSGTVTAVPRFWRNGWLVPTSAGEVAFLREPP